ncbi:MAG: cysteine--tRNA ligase [bacterium]
MTLYLHNTYSGQKEKFTPADPARVTMYVCGPTVYSYAHIGNARPAVVFDVLFRLLRELYGADTVHFARNLTDIDDKIIAAAQQAKVPITDITDKFAKIYNQDMQALGVLPPTYQPRATDHIAPMQELISRLLTRGHAYIEQDHILFSVESFAEYGKLAKLDQDEIIAGARVEIAPYKRNAADFVLWKPSQADEPGWDAPPHWGLAVKGRPGWHLECSAMIEAQLGQTIDIHGGGQDLRFPHHENEIAQSCCGGATGSVPLARYWLHNGFLTMGDEKMSKSLGNIVLPHDLLQRWQGEVIRFALLSAQYRQPLVWTDRLLQQSKTQLDRFYRLLADTLGTDGSQPSQPVPMSVMAPLLDDLNTPGAIAALHDLRDKKASAELLAAGHLLGLFAHDPHQWLKGKTSAHGLSDEAIDDLLQQRAAARQSKDFARSDAIRDQLASEGIVIEDGPDGATWRRR